MADTERKIQAGDRVELGRYPVDPIVWRVLAVCGSRTLLISEYGIAIQPYNKTLDEGSTWEGSHLQRWLEYEFGPAAGLPGKPFCLSTEEAEKYFADDDDRVCHLAFDARMDAVRKDVPLSGYDASSWWLRSTEPFCHSGSIVDAAGKIWKTAWRVSWNLAVRPALWVDLESLAEVQVSA